MIEDYVATARAMVESTLDSVWTTLMVLATIWIVTMCFVAERYQRAKAARQEATRPYDWNRDGL